MCTECGAEDSEYTGCYCAMPIERGFIGNYGMPLVRNMFGCKNKAICAKGGRASARKAGLSKRMAYARSFIKK